MSHIGMMGWRGEFPRVCMERENPSERITLDRLVLFLWVQGVHENLSESGSVGIFILKDCIATYLQVCTSTSSCSGLHHPVRSRAQNWWVSSSRSPPVEWQVAEVEHFRNQSQKKNPKKNPTSKKGTKMIPKTICTQLKITTTIINKLLEVQRVKLK